MSDSADDKAIAVEDISSNGILEWRQREIDIGNFGEGSVYDKVFTLAAMRQHDKARADKAEAQLARWSEREAACCPEDRSFEEMIQFGNRRIAELTQALAEAHRAHTETWLDRQKRATAEDMAALPNYLKRKISDTKFGLSQNLIIGPEPVKYGASGQGSNCPECGPNVTVDEDGCCASCGTDAVVHRSDDRE